MSNSKVKDERKYAQISPDTVGLIAESLGLGPLDMKVTRALAEDASYRCRELTNVASQLLKHSKRRRLTARDMNSALDLYDADRTYGHEESGSQSYHIMPDVGKASAAEQPVLYVPQERLVDLKSVALGPSPPIMASEPGIQASWLSLEGHYYPENEEQKPVEFPKQSNLTPALVQYYSAVANVMLGDSTDYFRVSTLLCLAKLKI